MIISQALNEARLNSVVAFLGAAATIVIYDATDTPLVTVALPNPVGVVADNALTLAASEEAMILASGNATKASLFNSNGQLALGDVAVTDLNGNGPLKLSETMLYAGGYTRLVGGALG